jgi:hypothetical protein
VNVGAFLFKCELASYSTTKRTACAPLRTTYTPVASPSGSTSAAVPVASAAVT